VFDLNHLLQHEKEMYIKYISARLVPKDDAFISIAIVFLFAHVCVFVPYCIY